MQSILFVVAKIAMVPCEITSTTQLRGQTSHSELPCKLEPFCCCSEETKRHAMLPTPQLLQETRSAVELVRVAGKLVLGFERDLRPKRPSLTG